MQNIKNESPTDSFTLGGKRVNILTAEPGELKKDFYSATLFQKLFKDERKEFFSPHAQTMASLVQAHVRKLTNLPEGEPITNVHNFLSDDKKSYDLTYGINKISQQLYNVPDELNEAYKDFLAQDLGQLLGLDFYYQTQLTIRLQTPHPSAKLFYPMFHSDIQLGHPPHEINVWLPLSQPSNDEGHGFALSSLDESIAVFEKYDFDLEKMKEDSAATSLELKETAKLEKCEIGTVLLFDTRKFHSTIPLEKHSRVSLDIRVMVKNEYERAARTYVGTGRKKVKFAPGFAYSETSINLKDSPNSKT